MILIPSLELMGGKVVTLREGKRDDVEVLADDPLAAAHQFDDLGAVFFHLVDLDAVFGQGDNIEVFARFAEQTMPCQVSGGVRSAERVEELLGKGVDRVVAGTLFYEQPDVAKQLVDRFGRRVMAALDVENGKVLTRGWESSSDHDLDAALALLQGTGVEQVVHTAVDRGHEASGPDLDGLRALLQRTQMQVFANVRVRGKDDIEALRGLCDEGLVGTVLAGAYRAVASV